MISGSKCRFLKSSSIHSISVSLDLAFGFPLNINPARHSHLSPGNDIFHAPQIVPSFRCRRCLRRFVGNRRPAIEARRVAGPVASFYVVDTEEQALRIANGTPFGLGVSIFTSDIDRGWRLAERIECGMVFINQPVWTAAELPFGGVKNSGFGRELSELGFGEFVNQKLINVAPAGAPPEGRGRSWAGLHAIDRSQHMRRYST